MVAPDALDAVAVALAVALAPVATTREVEADTRAVTALLRQGTHRLPSNRDFLNIGSGYFPH
jgi:hypothetical protein